MTDLTCPWQQDLSIDQQLALRTAAGDPAGLHVDGVRPIRDDLERRVRRLPDELVVPTT